MNQTAHISLQLSINFKERRDKSDWMRPNFLARPALSASGVVLRLVALRPVWRPDQRLSAAGEGVFTYSRPDPQPLFSTKVYFFSFFVKPYIFQCLNCVIFSLKPLDWGANRLYRATRPGRLPLYIALSTDLSPTQGGFSASLTLNRRDSPRSDAR